MTPPRGESVPTPRWLLGGRPIAELPDRWTLVDRACFALSRFYGCRVLGRLDLRWLGPQPYGRPLDLDPPPGTKVRVAFQQPDVPWRRPVS